MGLFDFLKKKEFSEIEKLTNELKDVKSKEAKLNEALEKYKPISNIENEISNKEDELAKLKKSQEIEIEKHSKKLEEIESKRLSKVDKSREEATELDKKYQESLALYKKLRGQVDLYDSKLDIIEYGVYEPTFDFEHSDTYRAEQKAVVENQKELIKNGEACICHTEWEISGSKAEGRKATKRNVKLALRAFNGECNSLIARVKWNNVAKSKERIEKSYNDINKLTESMTITIQSAYLELKIKELLLEHEYLLKREHEKDLLREAQEQMREEEKAKREFEKAQKEAEKEELNYQKALTKAKEEIKKVSGEKQDELQAKIEKLELELQESQAKKERAMSMAQQTKRGHVYVISNIGSFGENVYKIGMTRRLEPTDRVKELGDASVPFKFDIHAMMYSDDAPNLEKELHKAFDDKKVNMLNYRKEFFNVTLDEIESQIKETGIKAEFTKLPEAIEYRETLAILQKMNSTETEKTIDQEIEAEFPSYLN